MEMEVKLNEKQREVISTTKGPLLVLSCAGSGKTKTLIERTITLLKNGIKPQNIMLATFTNKASKELKVRISQELKKVNMNININDLYLGTLHSIFKRLIEENIEYSNYHPNIEILDNIDQRFFIFKNLDKFRELKGYNNFFNNIPAPTPWYKAKKILNWIDNLNQYALDKKISQNPDIEFLFTTRELYRKLLQKENMINYSNIEFELYQMLKNYAVLENIQNQIQYIMIDEYQDTSVIQEKILLLIADKYKNICVVGDDDQSIYKFRGAQVKNILEFSKKFKDCKIISLDINYRSELDIIRFCNDWIKKFTWSGNRFDKNMTFPTKKQLVPYKPVFRIGGENYEKWYANIYEFIKLIKSKSKIENYNQIVFLARSINKPEIKRLISYLNNKGIQTYAPRTKKFFEKIEIKLLIGVLLIYYRDTIYTRTNNKYLFFGEYNEYNEYYVQCINLVKSKITQNKDKELEDFLVNDPEQNEILLPFLDVIYKLLEFKIFKNYFEFKDKIELDIFKTHNISKFINILIKYDKFTNLKYIDTEYLKDFFMTYLKYLNEKGYEEYETEEDFPKDAVVFMTLHQAKGLEFPVVMVDSLYDEPWSKKYLTYENTLKDELGISNNIEDEERHEFRRLYYVGFSRARDLLALTSPEDKKNNIPSKIFAPFFNKLYDLSYFKKEILEKLYIEKIQQKETKKILSYSSIINQYEICPKKYNLVVNFDFKDREQNSVEYGIFFHKILESVNKYIIKYNKKPSVEEIQKFINDNKSKNKEYNFKDDKIFRSIEKYFKSSDNLIGNIFEKIFVSEYKVSYLQDDYLLYGVVDLICRDDKQIYIVDFKTGQFNEENMSKYKKQLILYKYLLREEFREFNIQTFLYFDELESPYIRIDISEQEIEKEIEHFNNNAKKIINKEFEPRNYDESCQNCQFKYLCKIK